MRDTDVYAYLNLPCRFRLKSGKEVFGVLSDSGSPGELVFLTAAEAGQNLNPRSSNNGIRLHAREIALIEKLVV